MKKIIFFFLTILSFHSHALIAPGFESPVINTFDRGIPIGCYLAGECTVPAMGGFNYLNTVGQSFTFDGNINALYGSAYYDNNSSPQYPLLRSSTGNNYQHGAINSFSFSYQTQGTLNSELTLKAYLFEISNNHSINSNYNTTSNYLVGNALWSGQVVVPSAYSRQQFTTFDVKLPNIILTKGHEYAVFLSNEMPFSQNFNNIVFGVNQTDLYTGGEMLSSFYGTTMDDLHNPDYGFCNSECITNNSFAGQDLAMAISITAAVPEPETYAMLLAGLGLVGAAVKRRKAKQA